MASDKKQQQQQQKQQKQNDKPESTLVRLSKIPVVEFSIFLALTAYTKVKSSSELLNNVLTKVESVTQVTFDGVKPYAGKFERQISYADSLGNSVLDKLENTVPSVTTFQPKNVYANTANRVSSWRRYVSEKFDVVRNFNVNKTVTVGLKTLNSLVDDYLPGADDETDNRGSDVEESISGELYSIFGKLKKRTLKKVQNVQRLVF